MIQYRLENFREYLPHIGFSSDLTSDLKKFDEKDCYFFYDESNNPRKIWLKQDGFNAPIDKNFILGGVMHFGKQDSTSIDELKSKLKLQKNAKELKFKHLY